MRLDFYYWINGERSGPLVASAYIAGNGNTKFPWPEGHLDFGELKLADLPGSLERWTERDARFRTQLRSELKQHIVVRNHDSLKPWTRLAFENIAEFGIAEYPFVYAKLIEDDGTEFDPANAIPLYGPNPGPVREDFQPPGYTPEMRAVEEAQFAEVQEMLRQRKLAKQKPKE